MSDLQWESGGDIAPANGIDIGAGIAATQSGPQENSRLPPKPGAGDTRQYGFFSHINIYRFFLFIYDVRPRFLGAFPRATESLAVFVSIRTLHPSWRPAAGDKNSGMHSLREAGSAVILGGFFGPVDPGGVNIAGQGHRHW